MRSKDFQEYIVVTKKPDFTVHQHGDEELPEEVEELTNRGQDKTFWFYTKDGELVGRFSVDSAAKWIMNIYDRLVE